MSAIGAAAVGVVDHLKSPKSNDEGDITVGNLIKAMDSDQNDLTGD